MQSLFYFNDVSQLTDFETFEVQPVSDCHSRTMAAGETPKFWSVIGTLKEENRKASRGASSRSRISIRSLTRSCSPVFASTSLAKRNHLEG